MLSNFATDNDIVALLKFAADSVTKTTGFRVLAIDMHMDTDNLHLDAWQTKIGHDLLPLDHVKPGCWWLSTGTAIHLRYAAENFPVEGQVLAAEQKYVASQSKRPKFRCYRNLEEGLQVDKWLRDWADNIGKHDERLQRRKRFEEFEKNQQRVTKLLNGQATTKAILRQIRRMRSELNRAYHTPRDFALTDDRLQQLKKRIAVIDNSSAKGEISDLKNRLGREREQLGKAQESIAKLSEEIATLDQDLRQRTMSDFDKARAIIDTVGGSKQKPYRR